MKTSLIARIIASLKRKFDQVNPEAKIKKKIKLKVA